MMLLSLEMMQFCLRMGFGESIDIESFGSSLGNPILGLGMGNGADPPAFSVLIMLICEFLQRNGAWDEADISLHGEIYSASCIDVC